VVLVDRRAKEVDGEGILWLAESGDITTAGWTCSVQPLAERRAPSYCLQLATIVFQMVLSIEKGEEK
jgi:hypothetical protein